MTIKLAPKVKLRCYPHSAAASGVLYCRYPEWREMRLVLDLLQPGDWFVDVGANIGVYSLLACSVEGVRALAFEPSSDSADRLMENIAINRLGSRIDVHRVAVGSRPGRGYLTRGRDLMNYLVPSAEQAEPVEQVDMTSLDDALTEPALTSLAVVKIDVEGAELAVLEGATRVLSESSPLLIVERNHPAAVASFLSARGYGLCDYDPDTRWLRRTDVQLAGQLNDIFVRDLAPWEARLAKPLGVSVA